jgi:hypothetical protein
MPKASLAVRRLLHSLKLFGLASGAQGSGEVRPGPGPALLAIVAPERLRAVRSEVLA